jgi:hypothetical protein
VLFELFSELLRGAVTVEFSERCTLPDKFLSLCGVVLVSVERPELEVLLSLFCVSILPVF